MFLGHWHRLPSSFPPSYHFLGLNVIYLRADPLVATLEKKFASLYGTKRVLKNVTWPLESELLYPILSSV